ncbi:MAG: sugar phosphate isomerase/epimerase family protein [Candidatus Bathyarchaeia archaeon]
MKIGLEAGSFAVVGKGFSEWINIAVELGIKYIEIWVDKNHFWPESTSHEEISKAVEELQSAGLNIISICPIPFSAKNWKEFEFEFNLAHPDERRRRKAIEFYKSVINEAALFGANSVLILPGKMDEPDRMKSSLSYRQYFEAAVKSLKELSNNARDFGVKLCIENAVIGNFGDLPEELAMLVEFTDPDNVRIYLDIANANVFFDPKIYINRLKNYLCDLIHATDNDGTYPYHLPIGKGTINYEEILRLLKRVGWDGYLLPEVFTEDPKRALKISKELLEEIIKKL